MIKIYSQLKIEVDDFGFDFSSNVARNYLFEYIQNQDEASKIYKWWAPCFSNQIFFSGFDRNKGLLSNTDGVGMMAYTFCDDDIYMFFGEQSGMLGERDSVVDPITSEYAK